MSSTRRVFLAKTALAGAAGAAMTLIGGGAADAEPRQQRPTFVFVSGNSATSFFWTPLVRELALLGHRSAPVELPGHGLDADFYATYQAPQDLTTYTGQPSVLATVTLADFADATIEVIRRVAEYGPVILVGHSLGGATLSTVGNLVPDLIDRLVYVSAFCCTASMPTVLDCIGAPENSGVDRDTGIASLGDPETSNITRMNFRGGDPDFIAKFRVASMAEATEKQFLAALNFTLQPDENAGVSLEEAAGRPDTWGRIPRSYVHCTLDRANTLPLQRKMVADADAMTPWNTFDNYELVASHMGGVLFRTRELAQILDRIAAGHQEATGGGSGGGQ